MLNLFFFFNYACYFLYPTLLTSCIDCYSSFFLFTGAIHFYFPLFQRYHLSWSVLRFISIFLLPLCVIPKIHFLALHFSFRDLVNLLILKPYVFISIVLWIHIQCFKHIHVSVIMSLSLLNIFQLITVRLFSKFYLKDLSLILLKSVQRYFGFCISSEEANSYSYFFYASIFVAFACACAFAQTRACVSLI